MRMYEAIHEKCGGQIAWIHNEKERIMAENFERMDGTYPKSGDRFSEKCPYCNKNIMPGEKILIEGINNATT